MDTVQTLALRRIITEAAKKEASDLHMSVGSRPMYRVDGTLRPMDDEDVLTQDILHEITAALTTEAQRALLEEKRDLIFTHVFENKVRTKMHLFYQEGFLTLSMRFLSVNVKTLRELNTSNTIIQFSELRHGLVLIGGANGSGRTTLAMALMEEINRSRVEHILTIEDPIEYNLVSNKSIIDQREIGSDVVTLDSALEFAQKEDVDVLFVSNLSGVSAFRKVLELAAGGIYVIAIMNIDSSMMALEQIVASFEEHEKSHIQTLLADVLAGVVIQSLLPKIGGGFVSVHEVLLNNASVKTLIAANRLQQIDQIIKSSRTSGMVSFDHELAQYVRDQEISLDVARLVARDVQSLELLVKN